MTSLLLNPPASPVQNNPLVRYQVQIIRDLDTFQTLAQQWDAFLNNCQVENLCLTAGWLITWLQHFPAEQLCILLVLDEDGQWVAVAPLMLNQGQRGLSHRLLKHCQFIGTNPTVFDWMDIPVRAGANLERVIDAVAETLLSLKWDVLDLQFFLDQEKCQLLNEKLGLGKAEETMHISSMIPFIELPETVEEYEQIKRKKTRLEVNRHSNRFVKEFGHAPTLDFLPATEETNSILTRFFNAHIKYWAERGSKSDFQRYPQLQQFYKNMLAYSHQQTRPEDAKLLFSIMRVGRYQLSYHLGFWQGRSYLSHLTNFNQGFRAYSPGTIHMDRLIYSTLDWNGFQFEFGRGDEPYKKMWAKDKKPLWNLLLFRRPTAQFLWQLDLKLKSSLQRKPQNSEALSK